MAVYKLPEKSFKITNSFEREAFLKLAENQEHISIKGPHTNGHVDARVKIVTCIEDGKDKNVYHGRLFMSHSQSFAAEYRVYTYNFDTKEGEVLKRGVVHEKIFTVLEPLTEENQDMLKK